MAAGPDPRDRITPTAFEIAPHLLGVRLATPVRRAVALGIDLLLAGIVSAVGGGAVVGLAAAVLFFLVAMRGGGRHPLRRVVRGALVFVGATILFGVGVAVVEGPSGGGDYGANVGNYGPGEDYGADVVEAVERDLEATGIDTDLSMDETPSDTLTPADRSAVADTLRRYADALVARDSAATDTLRPEVARLVAGRELRQRDARIESLRDRVGDLRDEVASLRETLDAPSFMRTARALGSDFGLTLGWIGVYFTLTLAFWGGYTPGKRAVGIRVVRLDGRPVSLWNAFERFGGYAAGIVTGLVGFAQVLWDPNRQGVEDKIAGTAVVRMADPETPSRVG